MRLSVQSAARPHETLRADLPTGNLISVHVAISEHLSLQLLRDGGLASFDLKGELELLVSDPALAKLKLALIAPSSSTSFANDIQFKHHPQVSKFAPTGPRVVALKDAKRDFPVGKGLGVVKWKLGGTKESQVPLGINCWPSAGEGNVEVNIEYELEAKHLTLRDVCISIPIPSVDVISSHVSACASRLGLRIAN